MKAYGFDINGPVRGEILCDEIDTFDRDYGMERVAKMFAWEVAFTTFKEAKKALVAEMIAEGTDGDLIDYVRELKASST